MRRYKVMFQKKEFQGGMLQGGKLKSCLNGMFLGSGLQGDVGVPKVWDGCSNSELNSKSKPNKYNLVLDNLGSRYQSVTPPKHHSGKATIFLQKPSGSEEFHQIVDFLADSHIMYALTANPTIYVSLIEQFWQTATVETVNEGEQQIIVTGLFSIAKDIQDTDEELARKVQEEEQTKVLEQQELERANLEAALKLQK
ncbi:hypothetical protein Tco_0548882 [Tanacetum coccineum]